MSAYGCGKLAEGRRHRWEGSIIQEAEKLVGFKDVSMTASECLILKPLVFIYFSFVQVVFFEQVLQWL